MLGCRMLETERLPIVVEAAPSQRDLAAYARSKRELIDDELVAFGAILFRGFDVHREGAFDDFVAAVSSETMSYDYGSTPRTRIQGNIYTATEYPNSLEIPLHNECAYQSRWPQKLAFVCVTPADQGGETPLADMERVHERLGDGVLEEFEQRRVKYVRHYRPYVDVPWQKVFQTDDREVLASICSENGIEATWLEPDLLRTVQTCQGVCRHPVTGKRTFFNQAHLFHVSRLGEEAARSLVEVFGADFLPRTAYFGDGAEIPAERIQAIEDAFRSSATKFKWNAGDVLLVDNMQVAHGRMPFVGPRRVLAALMDPTSEPAPTIS